MSLSIRASVIINLLPKFNGVKSVLKLFLNKGIGTDLKLFEVK